MTARSLLFSQTALSEPAACGPGRTEVVIPVRQNGRIYTMTLRDKVTVDDPYLMLVKATAFAIRTGEPYAGRTPERSVKDFLIRSNLVI